MEITIAVAIIVALSTLGATFLQNRHSSKRFEKELERAKETDYRQRRWKVRSEPLLKLRAELALMAAKEDKLVATITERIRLDVTVAEADKASQETLDDLKFYLASGDFRQTLFMQDDAELVNKAEEILRDYDESYADLYFECNMGDLGAKELEKSRKVLERNQTRIIEVQELINKRLEEL